MRRPLPFVIGCGLVTVSFIAQILAIPSCGGPSGNISYYGHDYCFTTYSLTIRGTIIGLVIAVAGLVIVVAGLLYWAFPPKAVVKK